MTVHNDFNLSHILWYKLGGTTRYLLDCESEEDILKAIEFIHSKNISKVFFCGLGANLIFTDEYYDGAVVRIVRDTRSQISQDSEGRVEAFAGEILDDVLVYSFEKGLTGLEWAGGLPGTLGAGVRGNVGAFGGEIKDTLLDAKILELQDGSFEIKNLSNENLQFAYRSSIVKQSKNMIVLSARFGLRESSTDEVATARSVYDRNKKYRADRHPLEYPNCGSVFKNINKKDEVEKVLAVYPDIQEKVQNDWHGKVSMGYLNHRLGFEGYRVGNAQVSDKHNNFIINLGGAKSSDVRTIITGIQQKFDETFGFQPEVEVEIVG